MATGVTILAHIYRCVGTPVWAATTRDRVMSIKLHQQGSSSTSISIITREYFLYNDSEGRARPITLQYCELSATRVARKYTPSRADHR
jgi:hypothetical protein